MGAAAALIGPIIGAASSIGGAVMSSSAQQDAIDSQNEITQRAAKQAAKVRQDEQARQASMREQAAAAQGAQVQQNTVENVQDQIDKAQQQAAQPAQTIASSIAAMSPSETALPSRANDDSVVTGDLAKRLAIAGNNVRAYAAPKSNLQAVGSVFGNIARGYNQAGDTINLINNERNSSLQTAQQQMGLVGTPYGVDDIKPNLAYASLVSGLGDAASKAYSSPS